MRGAYDYTIYKAVRTGRKLLAFIVVLFMVVSLSGDAYAAQMKAEAENAMRLSGGSGNVTITDSKGKKLKVSTKMRLDNGSQIATSSKSYAYINLDSSKCVKLDSLTKAEVRQINGKYAVLLNSGNLFLNVTSPLQDNETFCIKTSNMTMDIRGTCAQIEVIDAKHTRVCLLEGSLHCKITSIMSGESKTVVLLAGQAADFYLNGKNENDCKVVTEDINTGAIRGFVLQELYGDKSLAGKVYQQSGLDFRSLTQAAVDKKLNQDQKSAKTTSAKAKDDSKKAMQMDFLEDHDEGKMLYNAEGDVRIVPDNISDEQIAAAAAAAAEQAANGSGDSGSQGSSGQQSGNNSSHKADYVDIDVETDSVQIPEYGDLVPSPRASKLASDYRRVPGE